MTRLLADLTWPEAGRSGEETVLAVPVGATEQHGPHLPLSTDTDISLALALALSELRGQVVVAPPVAYGSSGEHAGFAGTLSIGQQAIELLLVELGRSASATFPRMLLISGHGGNNGPLQRAEQRLRGEGRDVRVFFPAWPSDAHAGRAETSLMLGLGAARVQLERAAAGATEPLAELLPLLIRSGVRGVSANGVLGDPAGASAAEGRALLDRVVGELVDLVDRWPAAPVWSAPSAYVQPAVGARHRWETARHHRLEGAGVMHMRISWGRVTPGSWPDYEKAFREGVEAGGRPEGLIARVLSRDVDDPNTGYTVSWWDSAEAMEAYETGPAVNDEILPRIQPFFTGAFVTNRLEIVMEKRYDE